MAGSPLRCELPTICRNIHFVSMCVILKCGINNIKYETIYDPTILNSTRLDTMEDFDRKKHWNSIYQNKLPDELSWYQAAPVASLEFFKQNKVQRTAKIIDIGGGDSLLVDHLIDLGYQDITVLDISEAAIDRVKVRLGDRAKKVTWIVADVVNFKSIKKFDFWHDRAAFHFLTRDEDVTRYVDKAQQCIKPGGILVIGTFSEQGPKTCSGVEIKQYSETTMADRLKIFFDKIKCMPVDHRTPLGILQHYIFCSFRRIQVV